MQGRFRRRVAWLLVSTVVLGLMLRKLPLGLPHFATKWGGTWLWGAMLWCIVTLLQRRQRPMPSAVLATGAAFAIEFLKLLHVPLLDRIRATSVGGFLLGHHFSGADLGVYAFAIVTMAMLGRQWGKAAKDG